jgi:hypothetical protein
VSGREKYLVERIDRRREHVSTKDALTARGLFLRMQARRLVSGQMQDITDPKEQAEFLGHLIDIAAEFRWPILGRVETATGLNATAADVCAVFKLGRAVAAVEAERLFSKMTPANDEAGHE